MDLRTNTTRYLSMIEKEPGAPAAHPGPLKWKTKLNDAAPAAERKSREPGMRRREAPGGLPRARRAQAVKPGSLSSGRIGYSSGPARTACGAGPSLKSAPTHNDALISWLPEWRRCERLRRPRIAAAVHHRKAMCQAVNAVTVRFSRLHIAFRLHRRLTPCGRATRTSAGKPGLHRLRLIRPWEASTFGFHRCVTSRVPDGFARLKREARRAFGYAVKSCDYLWNDLENTGVIMALVVVGSKLH
jgi:hypothetical protein